MTHPQRMLRNREICLKDYRSDGIGFTAMSLKGFEKCSTLQHSGCVNAGKL